MHQKVGRQFLSRIWAMDFAAVLVFSMAVALVFGVAVGYPFASLDDNVILLNNWDVRHFSFLRVFSEMSAQDFVPLTIASFALEHSLFGFDPQAFHFVNIVLHLLNGILLYIFLNQLIPKQKILLILATLLFLIHPLRVESVVWITEKKDVLFACFYLLGLNLYCRYLKLSKLSYLMGAFAAFVLSCLSKSTAVSFPFVLMVVDLYFGRRRQWIQKIPFVAFAFFHIFFQINLHAPSWNYSEGLGMFDRFWVVAQSWGFYFSKMVFPSRLTIYYEVGAFTWEAYEIALAMALMVFWIFVIFCERNKEVSQRFATFGFLFFAVVVLPALGFVPFTNNYMFADRYTYLPSIGLSFLIIACGLYWKYIPFIAAPLVVIFGVSAYSQVQVWQTNDSLWKNVLHHFPKTSMAYVHLGEAELSNKNLNGAIGLFEKALSINPKANVYNNLAMAYGQRGDLEKAKELFSKAVEMDPYEETVHSNFGVLYSQVGDLQKAKEQFQKALELNPHFHTARANLAAIYAQLNLPRLAIQEVDQVLSEDPQNEDALDMKRKLASLVGP